MNIFSLLDEVRTIAQNGLTYSQNPYDQERYERLLSLATQTYSELLEAPDGAVRASLLRELGYITPKVGADAAIFNQHGEILLMERADNTGWCLPCGFVEPNERPVDTTVREALEETGLVVAVRKLVGVFTRMPGAASGPHTTVAVVHLCDVVGGALKLSHEGKSLRYWPIDQVTDWHANHDKYARAAHALWEADGLLPSISE